MDDFKKFLKENKYEGNLEFQLCDLGLAFDEGKKLKWKPSEEQMLAIDTAINVLGKGTLNGKQLIELYQDLKKLKG
jgi:hypothetical protein